MHRNTIILFVYLVLTCSFIITVFFSWLQISKLIWKQLQRVTLIYVYQNMHNITQTLIYMYQNKHYGNTGRGVFKRGVQYWKDFCLRINILKGNCWILRIGLTERRQKVPKFDFQSQFSMSKIIRIFLNFFFIEEYQYRGMFFVLDIFWKLQFLKHFVY